MSDSDSTFSLVMVVNSRCQLKPSCKYCGETLLGAKRLRVSKSDVFAVITDSLAIERINDYSITGGGDPLIEWDFVNRIVGSIRRQKTGTVTISLITDGAELVDRSEREIIELLSKVDSIGISLSAGERLRANDGVVPAAINKLLGLKRYALENLDFEIRFIGNALRESTLSRDVAEDLSILAAHASFIEETLSRLISNGMTYDQGDVGLRIAGCDPEIGEYEFVGYNHVIRYGDRTLATTIPVHAWDGSQDRIKSCNLAFGQERILAFNGQDFLPCCHFPTGIIFPMQTQRENRAYWNAGKNATLKAIERFEKYSREFDSDMVGRCRQYRPHRGRIHAYSKTCAYCKQKGAEYRARQRRIARPIS